MPGTGLPDIFERIGALMADGDIDPSPTHYEFLYRFVTGSDRQVVDAVTAVQAAGHTLDARIIANIRRECYGVGRGGIARVIDEAELQLLQIRGYVRRSGDEARDYGDRLAGIDLSALPADQQRDMLAGMVSATDVMIARTRALQEELATTTREVDLLKADLEVARVESRSDALTGLANRKACCDYLDAQIDRAVMEARPLALVFLDIDHFKRFNDSYGHRVGDEVLRLVAQSLDRGFHGIGFASRWGGEEFVVVLPDCTADDAEHHAERFRRQLFGRSIRTRSSGAQIGRVTMSVGVTGLIGGDSAQSIIDRADHALYAAKAGGRDRVVRAAEAV